MLSFNNDDGRWYLLAPGIAGSVRAIQVVNDDRPGLVATMVVPMGDSGPAGVN